MTSHKLNSLFSTGPNRSCFDLVSLVNLYVCIIFILATAEIPSSTFLPVSPSQECRDIYSISHVDMPATSMKCHQETKCKKALMNACGKLMSQAAPITNEDYNDMLPYYDNIHRKLSLNAASWVQYWTSSKDKMNANLDKNVCIRSHLEGSPSPSVRERCRASIHVVSLQTPDPFASRMISNVTARVKLYKKTASHVIDPSNINGVFLATGTKVYYDEELFMELHMEGVYVESQASDAGMLCMIGCSEHDTQPGFSCHSNTGNINAHAMIQYPVNFSLTSRFVHGFLTSNFPVSHQQFFHPIAMSMVHTFRKSYFRSKQKYNYFASTDLISRACPKPHSCCKSSSAFNLARNIPLYFPDFTSMDGFRYRSLWTPLSDQCKNSSHKFNTTFHFGPFPLRRSQSESFHPSNVSLLLEDVIGGKWFSNSHGLSSDDDDDDFAVVFRLISDDANMNAYQIELIQPWDELTIVAQGRINEIGNAARDQICMLGCRYSQKEFASSLDLLKNFKHTICDLRICLMWQPNLSLKNRTILKGSISSLNSSDDDNGSHAFCPLYFLYTMSSVPIFPLKAISLEPVLRYEYSITNSWIDQQMGIQYRIVPLAIFQMLSRSLKRALLSYPLLIQIPQQHSNDDPIAINYVVQSSGTGQSFNYVILQLLSVDKLLSLTGWSHHMIANSSSVEYDELEIDSTKSGNLRLIAGTISLHQDFGSVTLDAPGSKIVVFNVEGAYDASLGKLEMAACKHVSEMPFKYIQQHAHLLDSDGQLDCKVHIRIRYAPSKSAMLNALLGPIEDAFTISATSTRDAKDPFFFPEIRLKVLSRNIRSFNKILASKHTQLWISLWKGLLTLCCLIHQCFHMVKTRKNTPYISLSMLIILGLGFTMSLIRQSTKLESQHDSMEVETLRYRLMEHEINKLEEFVRSQQVWAMPLEYSIRAFAALALVITIEIGIAVFYERFCTTHSGLAATITYKWKTGIILISIYTVFGYIIASVHVNTTTRISVVNLAHQHPGIGEYFLYAFNTLEDLFLLPQIMSNLLIWKSSLGTNVKNRATVGSKVQPLHVYFYVGLTCLRIARPLAGFFQASLMVFYVGDFLWWSILVHLGTACAQFSLALYLHLQQTT